MSGEVLNKKARRDYEFIKTFEAGIQLLGPEVKSIREGKANLKESYVRVRGTKAELVGCHISPYNFSRTQELDPLRPRKLLLKKKELLELQTAVDRKGLSIIPVKMYFTRGLCKLQIALGRGKKRFDKRQDDKKRETDRMLQRAIKAG